MSFEQALATLGHTTLTSKAPGLFDYEVGFQVLDKDDANSRAVGVFGFKVGDLWLYSPMFYADGEIRGQELLYVKNDDVYVPLTENWLNHFLQRRPNVLGKATDKSFRRIGLIPPNLYQLKHSPAKFASAGYAVPAWAADALKPVARAIAGNPAAAVKAACAGLPTLPEFLERAGPETCAAFAGWCAAHPHVHKFVAETYGDRVKQAFAAAGAAARAAAFTAGLGKTVGKQAAVISLRVWRVGAELPDDATDEMRTTAARGRTVVDDRRPDAAATKAYRIDADRRPLQTAGRNGIYEVLTKPGAGARCVVFAAPYGGKGRSAAALVVRLSDGAWAHTHPSEIWTRADGVQEDSTEYRGWFEGLAKAPVDGLQVAVGPGGQGTLPFVLGRQVATTPETYEVHWVDSPRSTRPMRLPDLKLRGSAAPVLGDDFAKRVRDDVHPRYLVLSKAPGGRRMALHGDALYLPGTARFMSLEGHACGCGTDSDPAPLLHLATAADIDGGVRKLAAAHETVRVRAVDRGREVWLGDVKQGSVEDAVYALVAAHGLREAAAREVVAAATRAGTAEYALVKAADFRPLSASALAPPIPSPGVGYDPVAGGIIPVQEHLEQNIPVPGLSSTISDREAYRPYPHVLKFDQGVGPGSGPPSPDNQALQAASQAAQTGQKEVFDLGAMTGLLTHTRLDSLQQELLPKLVKAMSSVGELLAHRYWNAEEWEDRFGRADMRPLTDQMRDVFEGMGDMILALKEKKVDVVADAGAIPQDDDVHDNSLVS